MVNHWWNKVNYFCVFQANNKSTTWRDVDTLAKSIDENGEKSIVHITSPWFSHIFCLFLLKDDFESIQVIISYFQSPDDVLGGSYYLVSLQKMSIWSPYVLSKDIQNHMFNKVHNIAHCVFNIVFYVKHTTMCNMSYTILCPCFHVISHENN